MSPWITGLIGGAIAAVLCALALRNQKAAEISRDGWKILHPSLLLHAIFILGFALTSLFAYIALSGGSSLPDADALASMVAADGLVELPEALGELVPGSMVDFLPFSEVS